MNEGGFRVMGFDLSLRRTGWCLLAGTNPELPEILASGYIAGNRTSEEQGGALLFRLSREVARVIPVDDRTFDRTFDGRRPDVIAIEDYTLGTARINPRTLADLAELGGIVRLIIMERHIPYTVWGPGEWKKHIFGVGKGGIKKDGVRLEAYKRWGIEIRDDNELEAYCIARAEWDAQHGRPRAATAPRKRAVTA